MSDGPPESLFSGLEEAVEPPESDEDAETAVRVSCSTADRASEVSLWPVDPAWTVHTVTTLGNQTWDERRGDRVVSGSTAHLANEFDVGAVQYVHDQDGTYGSFPRKHCLVSVDGETDTDAIRSEYPGTESVPVASLVRQPRRERRTRTTL